ncbi:MAG: hypothetical protein AAGI17_10115 [Planctomycetota bacterium]
MNRSHVTAAALASLALGLGLGGCASQYVGTWQGATPPGDDFQVGGMTLSPDGTYTAYATYANSTRGFTGNWDIGTDADGDDVLRLGSGQEYAILRDAENPDVITLVDAKTGLSTKLNRID